MQWPEKNCVQLAVVGNPGLPLDMRVITQQSTHRPMMITSSSVHNVDDKIIIARLGFQCARPDSMMVRIIRHCLSYGRKNMTYRTPDASVYVSRVNVMQTRSIQPLSGPTKQQQRRCMQCSHAMLAYFKLVSVLIVCVGWNRTAGTPVWLADRYSNGWLVLTTWLPPSLLQTINAHTVLTCSSQIDVKQNLTRG